MLNDIVERLRENHPEMPTRDRYEAADEIEHLRKQVTELEAALDTMQKQLTD